MKPVLLIFWIVLSNLLPTDSSSQSNSWLSYHPDALGGMKVQRIQNLKDTSGVLITPEQNCIVYIDVIQMSVDTVKRHAFLSGTLEVSIEAYGTINQMPLTGGVFLGQETIAGTQLLQKVCELSEEGKFEIFFPVCENLRLIFLSNDWSMGGCLEVFKGLDCLSVGYCDKVQYNWNWKSDSLMCTNLFGKSCMDKTISHNSLKLSKGIIVTKLDKRYTVISFRTRLILNDVEYSFYSFGNKFSWELEQLILALSDHICKLVVDKVLVKDVDNYYYAQGCSLKVN